MKGRILTSLLTVIALTGLQAQNIPAVPRLVVGLTIDQLRTDYIEAFSALYGERGFKRLWREGRIYRNAEYDFINVDKSSAEAAIIPEDRTDVDQLETFIGRGFRKTKNSSLMLRN